MKNMVNQTAGKGTMSAVQYLILSINGYIYAVGISFVRKIVELSHVSYQPREEPYILGVTTVDDAVYTVVDLRILFGGKYRALSRPAIAVLLAYGDSKICAVADDILSVEDVDIGGALCSFKREGYISGVILSNDAAISILSVNRLFD